jgi:hypothetical protein
MTLFQKISKWRETKPGLLTFIVIELGLVALFASWAIDSGSLLDYTIAFVALVNAAADLIRLGLLFSERKEPRKRT